MWLLLFSILSKCYNVFEVLSLRSLLSILFFWRVLLLEKASRLSHVHQWSSRDSFFCSQCRNGINRRTIYQIYDADSSSASRVCELLLGDRSHWSPKKCLGSKKACQKCAANSSDSILQNSFKNNICFFCSACYGIVQRQVGSLDMTELPSTI